MKHARRLAKLEDMHAEAIVDEVFAKMEQHRDHPAVAEALIQVHNRLASAKAVAGRALTEVQLLRCPDVDDAMARLVDAIWLASRSAAVARTGGEDADRSPTLAHVASGRPGAVSGPPRPS
jgi:hypothetical protein